jgi:outer membrane immunogenic protein
MRNLIVAVAALAAFSGTAQAQGVRIEAHGGYDVLPNSVIKAPKGVVYGGGIGYDISVGKNFFVGVEGNVDGSTADECITNNVAGGGGPIKTCLKLGRDFSGGVRLGVNLGDGNTKLYALGGYTNLRARLLTTQNGTTLSRDSGTGDGFRVGAGIERGFGGKAYGKLEYRYSNYSDGVSRSQGLVGIGIRF